MFPPQSEPHLTCVNPKVISRDLSCTCWIFLRSEDGHSAAITTIVCFQSVVQFTTGRVIYTQSVLLHFCFLYKSSENKVLPSGSVVCNSKWLQKKIISEQWKEKMF